MNFDHASPSKFHGGHPCRGTGPRCRRTEAAVRHGATPNGVRLVERVALIDLKVQDLTTRQGNDHLRRNNGSVPFDRERRMEEGE